MTVVSLLSMYQPISIVCTVVLLTTCEKLALINLETYVKVILFET